MSRPSRRYYTAEPAGTCDEERGEFWLGNPWLVGDTKRNLSAYEPNQVFLNLGGLRFANVCGLIDMASLEGLGDELDLPGMDELDVDD